MSEMTMESSLSLGALAKGLSAAQAKITGAKKDKKNPHTGSMYADLAGVWEACREPLTNNGLCVVQTTEPHGMEGVCVVTTLIHESGEWIRGRLFVPCVGQVRKDGRVMPIDAQTFGSALTYARRYALAAIVGVSPDDDDGEAAVRNSRERAEPPAKSPPANGDKVDVDALVRALETAKDAKELASASLSVGRVAKTLPKEALDRLSAAHDNRVRELERQS